MLRPVAQQVDKVRRSEKRPRQVIEMHGGPDSLSAEWLSDGLGLTERRPRWPTRYSIHFIGRRSRRAGSLIGEGGGSRSQNSRKDPRDGSSRRRGKKIGRHHRRNPYRLSKVPGLPIGFKRQKFPTRRDRQGTGRLAGRRATRAPLRETAPPGATQGQRIGTARPAPIQASAANALARNDAPARNQQHAPASKFRRRQAQSRPVVRLTRDSKSPSSPPMMLHSA